MLKSKRIVIIVIQLLINLIIFFIPSIVVNIMNLYEANSLYTLPGNELVYNFSWTPITAAIVFSKVFCYTIALLNLSSNLKFIFSKKNEE